MKDNETMVNVGHLDVLSEQFRVGINTRPLAVNRFLDFSSPRCVFRMLEGIENGAARS